MLLRALLFSGQLLVFAACDSGPDEGGTAVTTLTGEWTGTVESRGVTFTFEMTLSQEGDGISGTGSLASPQVMANYTVQGSYLHPFVDLGLFFTDQPGQPPMFLDLMVRNDRRQMAGPLTGFGFGGETLSLMLTRR